MRVAALQMNSKANVQENLVQLEAFFIEAKEQQVKLIVLPENFALIGKTELDKLDCAEIYGQGKIQETVAQLARNYCMWVIAGTMPIYHTAHRVKAACLVFNDQGECISRYDKIHLFDVNLAQTQETYLESKTIAPGENVVVVDTPIGRVGLSVCYDLRFPALYRKMILSGAEIFVVPSAFTVTTGQAHWEVLLRARAIENLSYVLAPNQSGTHTSGRCTYGHSMIVSPWGEILAQKPEGAGLVMADIDLPALHQLRQRFPCNNHHVLEKL